MKKNARHGDAGDTEDQPVNSIRPKPAKLHHDGEHRRIADGDGIQGPSGAKFARQSGLRRKAASNIPPPDSRRSSQRPTSAQLLGGMPVMRWKMRCQTSKTTQAPMPTMTMNSFHDETTLSETLRPTIAGCAPPAPASGRPASIGTHICHGIIFALPFCHDFVRLLFKDFDFGLALWAVYTSLSAFLASRIYFRSGSLPRKPFPTTAGRRHGSLYS